MVDVPQKTRPRLFLIDGYALIYRAFFAMISRPLTTSKGENTSAAFGFTRFLMKLREDYAPDYLGVVMDAGSSQRTELYADYKATREKMPDELSASMPRIRALLEAFRVPVLELEDFEADDVIGTLVTRAAERGVEAVIVSGDKDFYQLISQDISLLNPGRGGPVGVDEEWVDLRNASERLGVPPEHVVDYLALIGDSSDNIPGAPGIGPKTAIQLIEQYGPVESIIERVGEISGKRPREAIQQHADSVRLSKKLVTIIRDLPVDLDLEALQVCEPDHDALRDLLVDLEFHSLARDFAPAKPVVARPVTYDVARTPKDVDRLVAAARKAGTIAVDAVTTSDDPMRSDLVGLAIALRETEATYLPFGHRRSGELALDDSAAGNLPSLDSPELASLRALLEDASVKKVGHDLKFDLQVFRRHGVEMGGLHFDTMLASYLIDPGRRDHGLDGLVLQYLKHHAIAEDDVCGKGKQRVLMNEARMDDVARLGAERADLAIRLHALFEPELERYELTRLYEDIEMPLLTVLASMEQAGVRIDLEFFRRTANRLETDLHRLRREIFEIAGGEFNINSTPQLREILFDKLQLPILRKTKTGASTDASVLDELAKEGHRFPVILLEYRHLDKLKGTYVDALPQHVNSRTHRIHTRFEQAVAATGRLSSSDPNLQNIPIRTEVGADLRRGFIPEDGYLLLSADYSQIELRVLAHLSGDPAFVDAFSQGLDIHRQTAALVFDVPVADVTAEMRAAAKTINFATIYGIGPHALSAQLNTSYVEAKQFIEAYFKRLPDITAYLESQKKAAYEKGYVETIAGRRRYVPEVRSKNHNIRSFGERAAMNAPVQGSAADIIKVAMIDVHRAVQETGAGIRMLLQVHDELVFEVPKDEADAGQALVRDKMEHAFALRVPLEVATGVGENWLEAK